MNPKITMPIRVKVIPMPTFEQGQVEPIMRDHHVMIDATGQRILTMNPDLGDCEQVAEMIAVFLNRVLKNATAIYSPALWNMDWIYADGTVGTKVQIESGQAVRLLDKLYEEGVNEIKMSPTRMDWYLLTWTSGGTPQLRYSDNYEELAGIWRSLTSNGANNEGVLWKAILPVEGA